jgi:hypothetical protein
MGQTEKDIRLNVMQQINVDGKYTTPFHYAARYHRNNILKYIINIRGIDINGTMAAGHTPLMTCLQCSWRYKDTDQNRKMQQRSTDIVTSVRLSLSHPDIDVNKRCGYFTCQSNSTLLLRSFDMHNLSIFSLLLKHKSINVNLCDARYNTALTRAVNELQADYLRQLTKKTGLNVNAITDWCFERPIILLVIALLERNEDGLLCARLLFNYTDTDVHNADERHNTIKRLMYANPLAYGLAMHGRV